MPKKVYNNVLDQRLLDNGRVVEDVTSVGLPTINRPTTNFDVSGMAGGVDVPNQAKVEPMELTINHNNGVNCKYLSAPGTHRIELRTARQVFDVKDMDVGAVATKYIITCLHKSTTDGTIEAGNPIGSTETYSIIKYEKIDNGEQIDMINISSGDITHMGVTYTDEVKNLLR